MADEISATYPFHPQFKNIVALFKENETYRQTRGLGSTDIQVIPAIPAASQVKAAKLMAFFS